MKVLVFKKELIYRALLLMVLVSVSVFAILFAVKAIVRQMPVSTGDITIMIDPGHGGIDGGATVAGILEKDINLDISLKVRTHLILRGYKVAMTREEDVSLEKYSRTNKSRYHRDLDARVEMINNCGARLFVSIHTNCNLKAPRANSAIVFYSNSFQENKTLAYCIQKELNSLTFNDIGRAVHDPRVSDYFILKRTKMPGVIVETAFLSNPQDRKLLMDNEFREEIAEAVAAGIDSYFTSLHSKVMVSF